MQACILNERYEEAINLFDALVKTYAIAGEFHWGGGQDRMHPACRDLAMRAYGGVLPLEEKENILNDVPDSKTPALDLFNSVISEGDTKVSIEALTGVVRECENDGRWEDAVDVFTTILDIERRSTLRPDLSPSILLHGGKSFHLFRSDVLSRQKGVKTKKNLTQLASDLGYVVNPVMRTCNANKKFGVSLLCLLLFEMAILEPSTSSHTLYRHLAGKNENVENDSPKVSSCNDGLKLLVPIISSFRNIDDILTTVMVALCGLESPSDATFLYENKHELFPRQICSSFKPSTFKIDFPLPMQSVSDNFKSSNSIYNYSLSQVKPNIYRLQPAWDVIAREINKFTSALNSIEANDEKISVEDAVVLSSILATIIRITSRAAHPEMGIQLAKWAESYSIEVEKENVWTKNVEMVAIVSNNETSKSRFINKKRFQSPLALTDSLLSSLSEAFRKGNDLKASKTITNTYLSHIEHPNEWFLTRHETLKNLVAQRDFSSVTTLFHEILVDHKNPDIFCTVGTSMLSENDFNALIDLYRLSISSECMSEELNVLALNAVTLGKVDRDMAFLDSIIMESCYLLGEKKEVYLATKYWSLKRRLGPYSQRLMLWFDPKTRYLHELQLAIETLEKRSTDRLNPRTNALKYIITYAATFNENPLPEYVTTLPLVPRDKEEWTKLLEKVLQEAKYTRILDEPNTIENLTLALRSLGCFEKCIDIVNDALYRGIRVWQRTIDETLLSAREADLEHLTYDIRPFAND